MITVNLPSQLAGLVDGKRTLSVQAATLGEVFNRIDELGPMIRSQVLDANGSIRQFVGLFLNNHQLTEFGNGSLQLAPDSELLIVMAVAGG